MPGARVSTRLTVCVRVMALALLVASCGTGYDGGGRRIVGTEVLGGALKPSPVAYSLTSRSDVVQPDLAGDDLPVHVDLRRDDVIAPIQNQTWNSCVGWSLGYYLMSSLEAREKRTQNATLDMNDPENWFSPDYLYSQRETDADELAALDYLADEPLCTETDGVIGCMRPERALASLMRYGCARWPCLCGGSTPGSFRSCGDDSRAAASSLTPWQLAEPCAFFHRPRCFVRFGSLRDPDIAAGTVRQMQSWLHLQGTPIAIVVRTRENWVTYRGQNRVAAPVYFRGRACGLTEERGVCLDAGGRDLSGQHMMTIIGYDRSFPSKDLLPQMRDDQQGSFLVANQWGTKWGDGGYMWIPVSELQKIWIGGYGLIKWTWATPIPGNAVVCAQDTQGRWIDLSCDGDDVPKNLVKVDPACNDPCEREVGITAQPLVWSGGEAQSGEQSVGGLPTCPPGVPGANVVDSADWYVLEVSEAGRRLGVAFDAARFVVIEGLQVPLHRVLDVRITDDDFRNLTVVDPATGGVHADLCEPGRYFVRIAPDEGDQYGRLPGQDPRVDYAFTATLGPGPDECGAPEVAATRDAYFTHTFEPEPIAPGEANPRRYHWLNAATRGHHGRWGGNTRIRVSVEGLAPGARLQVVMGGYQSPRLRALDSVTVDADGATWLQGESSHIYGAHEPLIMTRSLTPGVEVAYRLTVSILPAPGNTVPAVEDTTHAVDVRTFTELPAWLENPDGYGGWALQGPSTDAFQIMRDTWGAWREGVGIRDFIVELRHACPDPSIHLVAPDGGSLPPGVRLVDAPNAGGVVTPGVTRKRILVPLDYRGDVFGYVRDASGQPLRDFSLRTRMRPSLYTWPFFEGIEDGAGSAWDENNGPSNPTPLSFDEVHHDTIGFFQRPTSNGNALSWDLFDYYVIENPGPERTVTVRVAKDQIAGLILRWWEPDGTVIAYTLGVTQTTGSYPLHLAAGERKILLMYSGTQAPTIYSMEVSTD